jgi:hypothetical protein
MLFNDKWSIFFIAISWHAQVRIKWGDYHDCLLLDQHMAQMDFNSARSLKQ